MSNKLPTQKECENCGKIIYYNCMNSFAGSCPTCMEGEKRTVTITKTSISGKWLKMWFEEDTFISDDMPESAHLAPKYGDVNWLISQQDESDVRNYINNNGHTGLKATFTMHNEHWRLSDLNVPELDPIQQLISSLDENQQVLLCQIIQDFDKRINVLEQLAELDKIGGETLNNKLEKFGCPTCKIEMKEVGNKIYCPTVGCQYNKHINRR